MIMFQRRHYGIAFIKLIASAMARGIVEQFNREFIIRIELINFTKHYKAKEA